MKPLYVLGSMLLAGPFLLAATTDSAEAPRSAAAQTRYGQVTMNNQTRDPAITLYFYVDGEYVGRAFGMNGFYTAQVVEGQHTFEARRDDGKTVFASVKGTVPAGGTLSVNFFYLRR